MEVVPPSPDVALPLFAQFAAGFALPGVPVFFHFLFKFCDGFRAHPDFAVLVEPEPEQAALAARPCSAFLPVDLQPEFFPQLFHHAYQGALCRSRAGREDRDVVCTTNEAHSSFLQFLV